MHAHYGWKFARRLETERYALAAALKAMVDAAHRQPGNASLQGLADLYEPLITKAVSK